MREITISPEPIPIGFTTLEASDTSFREQVINDHMSAAWRKMRCDYFRARLADAPRRSEFSIVKKSGVEFDRLQDFRQNIHMNAVLGRQAKESGQSSNRVVKSEHAVKKTGCSDKHPSTTLF